jgi:hypothetical protein
VVNRGCSEHEILCEGSVHMVGCPSGTVVLLRALFVPTMRFKRISGIELREKWGSFLF